MLIINKTNLLLVDRYLFIRKLFAQYHTRLFVFCEHL